MTGIGQAGDTMNQELKQREQLSALADGQLDGDELAEALRFAAQDEGRGTWQLYHLVGDTLRSSELARAEDGGAFLARLRQQLAQEPAPLHPVQAIAVQTAEPLKAMQGQAANASVFRWKMVAGFASLAAVAAIGWNTLDTSRSGVHGGPQLAVAPGVTATQVATVGGQEPQVMLRDPRLDELLAAHKQFGGATALQMPAGYLRNANFDSPSR